MNATQLRSIKPTLEAASPAEPVDLLLTGGHRVSMSRMTSTPDGLYHATDADEGLSWTLDSVHIVAVGTHT